jgi:hypothetical protein
MGRTSPEFNNLAGLYAEAIYKAVHPPASTHKMALAHTVMISHTGQSLQTSERLDHAHNRFRSDGFSHQVTITQRPHFVWVVVLSELKQLPRREQRKELSELNSYHDKNIEKNPEIDIQE